MIQDSIVYHGNQLDYLEDILDRFHDGIYITDKEANTVYLNHSYELISGLTVADMLGKNMKNLVEQGVISTSGTLAVLETGKETTIEQSFRTGKRAVITSMPVYERKEDGKEKNILMVLTVVREMTEIYSVRKELQRQKQMKNQYYFELEKLRMELNGGTELITEDARMHRLMQTVDRVTPSDVPVLLLGEAGTGKGSIAAYIHKHSSRANRMFLRISFSAVPKSTAVEYLFGSEDSVTGEFKMGILESAAGGTVYFSELADMPEEIQGRILALLREHQCVMGDGSVRQLDIRILAGSRYSWEELQQQPNLNAEILDRMSVFALSVPALRERPDDIVPLIDCFVNIHNRKTGEKKKMSREAYQKAMEYDWPGNVRELEVAVERAAIICPEEQIRTEDLFMNLYEKEEQDQPRQEPKPQPKSSEELPPTLDLRTEVARFESAYMARAFEKYGNVRDAAEYLGIDSSTFTRKRQKYEQMGLMNR